MKDKVKVLFIMNSLNCGGEENFVMNVYRTLASDKVDIFFCVPDVNGEKQYFEDEIVENGDIVYKIPSKSKHPFDFYKRVKNIVLENSIECVHYHSENSMMFWGLLAAKRGKASLLIAHSHSSNVNGLVYHLLHYAFRPALNYIADIRYACSKVAGKWMYGEKTFEIINNGIDLKKFYFNINTRNVIRKEYGLTDKFVVGHVGRLAEVKNHSFLIEIFDAFCKCSKSDVVLLLVGDGELRNQLQRKVENLRLENKVIFLGNKQNVTDYLQAMDCFVFPSLYEGLPVSLVEAQATGLPCIVSDRVSREAKITSKIEFLSLEEGVEKWKTKLIDLNQNHPARELCSSDVEKLQRYDIQQISDKLLKVYERMRSNDFDIDPDI